MANTSDFANIPGVTKEMRDSIAAAFDALSTWRVEIEKVNDRCLGKVLDRTSAIARSMGWPDQAIRTTQAFLEKASKVQIEMIDHVSDSWKQQLRSPSSPMAIQPLFASQVPSGMPEFNPLAPWSFWLQAAEMWRRSWMPDVRSH
jgi:hypothetical protein